jgi:hypothetical protein
MPPWYGRTHVTPWTRTGGFLWEFFPNASTCGAKYRGRLTSAYTRWGRGDQGELALACIGFIRIFLLWNLYRGRRERGGEPVGTLNEYLQASKQGGLGLPRIYGTLAWHQGLILGTCMCCTCAQLVVLSRELNKQRASTYKAFDTFSKKWAGGGGDKLFAFVYKKSLYIVYSV